MENIKIDFRLFDEYKNITEKINEIKEWYKLRRCVVDKKDLNDKIFENLEDLKKEFTEREHQLLTELTNYLSGNRYDVSIKNNYEDNEKIKVFNYLYWRYKNINEKLSLNIIETKKILNLKSSCEYKKPFKLMGNCAVCGKHIEIYIDDYNEKFLTYECKNCNHNNRNNDGRIVFPINCNCEKCRNIENEFFEVFKSNMHPLLVKTVNYIYDELKELIPSETELDEIMLEDYKMNRAYLDKDLRELISLKPKNIEHINKIIKKISHRKRSFNNDDDYEEMINQKLLERKISYKLLDLNKGSIISKMIKGSLIDNYYWINNNYKIDEVSKLIVEDIDIDEFKKKIQIELYGAMIKNRGVSILIPFNEDYEKYISLESIFKEKVILNKYFFEYNKNIDEDIDNGIEIKHVRRLFQSDAENSVYIDLKNKYSENVIAVNYKIRDVIILDKIKDNLTVEEYKYLNNNASFNFVIYDKHGNAKKVIQACIGTHHNEEEWIIKDRIKKKVCGLVGIDFEEIF